MLPFVACQPSGQKAALARVGSEEWRCGSNRGQHRDFEDIELKAGHAEGTADRRWDGFTWVSTWKKFSHSGKGWHPRCWLPSPSEPLQVLGPNQLRVEGCGRSETRVQGEHSVPTECRCFGCYDEWPKGPETAMCLAFRQLGANDAVSAGTSCRTACLHFSKLNKPIRRISNPLYTWMYIYIYAIYISCVCVLLYCVVVQILNTHTWYTHKYIWLFV